MARNRKNGQKGKKRWTTFPDGKKSFAGDYHGPFNNYVSFRYKFSDEHTEELYDSYKDTYENGRTKKVPTFAELETTIYEMVKTFWEELVNLRAWKPPRIKVSRKQGKEKRFLPEGDAFADFGAQVSFANAGKGGGTLNADIVYEKVKKGKKKKN